MTVLPVNSSFKILLFYSCNAIIVTQNDIVISNITG